MSEAEERALHGEAVWFDQHSRGKIRFQGSARVAFLQRMLTNRIEGLDPGQGTRAELLDVKGHVLADLRLYVSADHIHADIEPGFTQSAIDRLRMFVLRDDVQVTDVTADLEQVTVAGPAAAAALDAPELGELALFAHTDVSIDGKIFTVVRTDWTTEPTFDLFCENDGESHAHAMLRRRGVLPASGLALEVARIEAGVARQGHELVEGILPLEAELYEKAIIEKGCYPGQEVIVRILHRGHTNRTLVGLTIEGAEPADNSELRIEGKAVGLLTSQAYSGSRREVVALGVVRREHANPGTHLKADGRTAVVHSLPLSV